MLIPEHRSAKAWAPQAWHPLPILGAALPRPQETPTLWASMSIQRDPSSSKILFSCDSKPKGATCYSRGSVPVGFRAMLVPPNLYDD